MSIVDVLITEFCIRKGGLHILFGDFNNNDCCIARNHFTLVCDTQCCKHVIARTHDGPNSSIDQNLQSTWFTRSYYIQWTCKTIRNHKPSVCGFNRFSITTKPRNIRSFSIFPLHWNHAREQMRKSYSYLYLWITSRCFWVGRRSNSVVCRQVPKHGNPASRKWPELAWNRWELIEKDIQDACVRWINHWLVHVAHSRLDGWESSTIFSGAPLVKRSNEFVPSFCTTTLVRWRDELKGSCRRMPISNGALYRPETSEDRLAIE